MIKGRLGYDIADKQVTPKKVEIKAKIIAIAGGDWHAAALTGANFHHPKCDAYQILEKCTLGDMVDMEEALVVELPFLIQLTLRLYRLLLT